MFRFQLSIPLFSLAAAALALSLASASPDPDADPQVSVAAALGTAGLGVLAVTKGLLLGKAIDNVANGGRRRSGYSNGYYDGYSEAQGRKPTEADATNMLAY